MPILPGYVSWGVVIGNMNRIAHTEDRIAVRVSEERRDRIELHVSGGKIHLDPEEAAAVSQVLQMIVTNVRGATAPSTTRSEAGKSAFG